jgi:uncharacterized membrane protein
MRATEPTAADEAADRDALLRRTELIISGVLRVGVLLSAGLIALGVVLFYVRSFSGGHAAPATPAVPHSIGDVVHGLGTLDPTSIIATGLLVLLATPVVRVAVSIVAFALERDRTYVVITSLVLLILLISFVSGRGGG